MKRKKNSELQKAIKKVKRKKWLIVWRICNVLYRKKVIKENTIKGVQDFFIEVMGDDLKTTNRG